jgi:hypothetical protein
MLALQNLLNSPSLPTHLRLLLLVMTVTAGTWTFGTHPSWPPLTSTPQRV